MPYLNSGQWVYSEGTSLPLAGAHSQRVPLQSTLKKNLIMHYQHSTYVLFPEIPTLMWWVFRNLSACEPLLPGRS